MSKLAGKQKSSNPWLNLSSTTGLAMLYGKCILLDDDGHDNQAVVMLQV